MRRSRKSKKELLLATSPNTRVHVTLNPYRVVMVLVGILAVGAVVELVLPKPPVPPQVASVPAPAPSSEAQPPADPAAVPVAAPAPDAAAPPAPPPTPAPTPAANATTVPAADPAAPVVAATPATPQVVIKQSMGEPAAADRIMGASQWLGRQAATGVDKQFGDRESRMEYWVIHPLTNAHRKLEPVMPFFGVALGLFWIGLGFRRVGKKAGMPWWTIYWLTAVVLAVAAPSLRDWNNTIYAAKGAAARLPLVQEDTDATSPDKVEAKVKSLVEIPHRLGVSQPLADMKFGKAGSQPAYAKAVEDGRIEGSELPENAKVAGSRNQAFVAIASLPWTIAWAAPIVIATHVAQVAEGYTQLLGQLLPFLLMAYCIFDTPGRIKARRAQMQIGFSMASLLRWWCLLTPVMLLIPLLLSVLVLVLLKLWDGASVGTSFVSYGTWAIRLIVLAAVFSIGVYLSKCVRRDLRARKLHADLPLIDGGMLAIEKPSRGRRARKALATEVS